MSLLDNHLDTEIATIDRLDVEKAVTSPSIFGKCDAFFEAGGDFENVVAADLYPYFRPLERNDGTHAVINGHDVIMAGSNNSDCVRIIQD